MTPKLTNIDVFVLGMSDAADNNGEFFEWDATVTSWKRDPSRYGLRGYEDDYPDHKKVANNYMDSKSGAIGKGFMEKVSMNRYRITPLGRRRAAHLTNSLSGSTDGLPESIRLTNSFDTASFDRLQRALETPSFTYYAENSSVHPNWNFTAALLRVSASDSRASLGNIRQIVQTIKAALIVCTSRQEVELRRSAANTDNTIAEMTILSLLILISDSIRYWNEDLLALDIPIDQLLGEINDVFTEYEESKGSSIETLLDSNN